MRASSLLRRVPCALASFWTTCSIGVVQSDSVNYNITMGSASSRCTEHNGEAEISFDSCDASELALQSASDLVRRSKIPIVTVRLSQIYNRNLSVFFAWSIFFSQSHAKRRLQYAKDVNLGSNLLARGAFMRMDPSEPRDGLLLPSMILSSCTCLEVTYSAYMRFCACSLTTHLIIFLSGATRDLHRSSIVRQQVLNRVYSYGFVQVVLRCYNALKALMSS